MSEERQYEPDPEPDPDEDLRWMFAARESRLELKRIERLDRIRAARRRSRWGRAYEIAMTILFIVPAMLVISWELLDEFWRRVCRKLFGPH